MALPATYNDARISELSRRVFYRAGEEILKILDAAPGTAMNYEKLHALAAVLDGAAGGFAPSEEFGGGDDDDD